jgi:glycosyltransferase involved in cell wall biosynthesis
MDPSDTRSAKGQSIVFLTRTMGYGGTEKHLLELVTRLAEHGEKSTILCVAADPFSARCNYSRPGFINIVQCGQTPASFRDWLMLFRRYRSRSLVFVHGEVACFGWHEYVAAKLAGSRRILAIQQLTPPPLPNRSPLTSPRAILQRVAGWRTRYLLGRSVISCLCDQNICVSDAVRRSLTEVHGYSPAKAMTVRNGVNVSSFAPDVMLRRQKRHAFDIADDELVLVCAARVDASKGIDVLIEAVAEAIRRNCKCRCFIIGHGALLKELSEVVRARRLSDRIIFEGFKNDVRPYFQMADAFILTSHNEGLSIAMLEAMACGLPCIVTIVGGAAEAITNGREGLLVSPGDTNEICNGICRLAANPSERVEMGRRARMRVCEDFDTHKAMNKICATILGETPNSDSGTLVYENSAL